MPIELKTISSGSVENASDTSHFVLFIDSADSSVKLKDNSGTVTSVGGGGSDNPWTEDHSAAGYSLTNLINLKYGYTQIQLWANDPSNNDLFLATSDGSRANATLSTQDLKFNTGGTIYFNTNIGVGYTPFILPTSGDDGKYLMFDDSGNQMIWQTGGGGGSQSPWTGNIDADSHDLNNVGNINLYSSGNIIGGNGNVFVKAGDTSNAGGFLFFSSGLNAGPFYFNDIPFIPPTSGDDTKVLTYDLGGNQMIWASGGGSDTPWTEDHYSNTYKLTSTTTTTIESQNGEINLNSQGNIYVQPGNYGLNSSAMLYFNVPNNVVANCADFKFNARGNIYFNVDSNKYTVASGADDGKVLTYDLGSDSLIWATPTGGSQTPWASDIDAASYNLNNLTGITGTISGGDATTITLTGKDGVGSDKSGGGISLIGGVGTGIGYAGSIQLFGGNGDNSPGIISLTAGNTSTTDAAGGSVTLASGNSTGGGLARHGGINLVCGSAVFGGNAHGGNIYIAASNGQGTDKDGGNVTIASGDNTGAGTNGYISIEGIKIPKGVSGGDDGKFLKYDNATTSYVLDTAGGLAQAALTSSGALSVNTLYHVDSTSGTITADLPTSGVSDGDTIELLDVAGMFSTNNITIPGSGSFGTAVIANGGTKTLSTNYGYYRIIYNNASTSWVFEDLSAAVSSTMATVEVTTTATLTYNTINRVHTTSGAFTVTLPSNGSTGDKVIIIDSDGTFNTNNLTVATSGEAIEGSFTQVLDKRYGYYVFIYTYEDTSYNMQQPNSIQSHATLSIKTTTYTATDNDYILVGNHATTPFTITLPAVASIATGKMFIVKNKNVAVVTVAGNGTELLDSSNTQPLNQYDSITIVNDGSKWLIL